MAIKNCQNCERIIGNFEESYSYYGYVVCKECMKRLEKQLQGTKTTNYNIEAEIPTAEVTLEQEKDVQHQIPEIGEQAIPNIEKDAEHFEDKASSVEDDNKSAKEIVSESAIPDDEMRFEKDDDTECESPFDEKHTTTELSDPRPKGCREMTPRNEQARKRLRNAGLAGCISTGITFLCCLISATENESMDFSLWATAFISLILTIWIFKGSRLAATWMFVLFLINKLAALSIFKLSLFDVVTVVFLYFYFQGARAAFAIHKEKTQEPSPPPLPTTNKTPWLAAVSLVTVVILTLSLPIKLVSSYFDSRPSKYPLHFAVAKGDLVTIDKLLQEGHDINFGGPLGTPLTVAAAAGRAAVIQHLIDRGSDPNLPDWKGWKPLHCAIIPDQANLAAITTLVRNGADVNGKDKHLRTPLHRAAQFGHADAVRLLLSLGAQPDAVDENGWTPFDRAEKHSEIQAILQKEIERKKR